MTPPAMDAATFRQIRIKAGLFQHQLAARMQRDQWLISDYELGKKEIPPDIAEFMTKLGQGKAASSPPKRRQAESRKTPPSQRLRISADTRVRRTADTLCGRCLCVTDKRIPCGCWSWAG